jgi:hypothetical protein
LNENRFKSREKEEDSNVFMKVRPGKKGPTTSLTKVKDKVDLETEEKFATSGLQLGK